jgi:N-acetylneuraminic acid mutarotase
VKIETLESRRLLAATPFAPFAASINFQTLTDTTVPPNYRADIGAPYGLKRNGLTYGWSSDVSASAVDRGNPISPDERYDAFVPLAAGQTWQMKVPGPGTYWVRVVAGDPSALSSAVRITAEHVIVTEGKTTTKQRWLDGRTTVAVTDGALTLEAAPGSVDNRLCFVQVVRTDPPASAPVASGKPNARTVSTITNAISWADQSNNETGFRIERARGAGGAFMLVGVVGRNVTRFVDTNLRPGTKYIYRIRAFNAVGGSVASATDDARTFNASGGQIDWEEIAPSPVGRAEALTATIDRKLYVFGGFDAVAGPIVRSDVYDPTTNAWTRIADLPRRLTHAGVAVLGRDVYVAGGYIGIGPGFEQQFGTTEVWRYNVDDNSWTPATALPTALAGGGLVALGRTLHWFGGNDSSRADASVHYVLDLDNPTAWNAAAALPSGRSHLGYLALGGKIYAIGGQFGNDAALTTQTSVHVWNPASPGAWIPIASLPAPTSHIASSTFILGGRIVVAGGEHDHEDPTSDVFIFDPVNATWDTLTSLPSPRFSGAARAIEGVLYFTGGSTQTTTYRGVFAG